MRHRRGRSKSNKADTGIALKKFKPRRKFGERPLNNQLLRIHLPREDLDSLKEIIKRSVTKKSTGRPTRSIIQKNLSFPPTSRIVKPNTVSKVIKTSNKVGNSFLKSTDEPKNLGNKSPIKSPTIVNTPEVQKTTRIILNPKRSGKDIKMNGTAFFPESTKVIKSYYIKFPAPPQHTDGRLEFKFTQLVNDVKTMLLPTLSWKIKVIIKTQKISAVVFTNKADVERSVTFTADKDTYDIVFDNKPAVLLGSPNKVSSSKEIELMLQVLEQLEKDSPMVLYK